MKLGSFWAWGLYGLLTGALSVACGAGDGKRSARACPEDCPAAQCDVETGQCLSPPDEPQGGSGGNGNEPTEPNGGMPNPPQVGEDDQAPSVVVTGPEEGAVLGTEVTFEFEADEPSSYTCRLNGVVVPDCEPGITLTDLDSGENTFSVIATDEAGNESELVEVTFVVNRAPEIGDIDDIVTPEDTSTGELPFTISDPDTDIAELTVTATLDSDFPIPEDGLLLTGDGEERTLVLNPAPDAFGPAILTIEVSDGFVTTTKEVNVTVTPVNDPPAIEDVPNQRVAEHSVLGPVPFKVGDVETPAADLVVTASSSDQQKVPNANIVLGGSGEDRTFTITPVAQQSGTVTITLTVSDGELSASDTFVLTLASTDDEPTISAIANQTTPEDTPKTVAFTVGDPDTPVASLVPSASFAANGIVQSVTFGGSGANRTFTVTPKPNQHGEALITITISDASGGVSRTFQLTVTPVNDAPTLTAIANQVIAEDTSTGALGFTVADVDSANVTVTGSSSNTTLIPNGAIVVSPFSGAPGARTVTVTPVANGSGGPVTITLTASDGSLTATRTFTVTVTPVNDAPALTAIANQVIAEDTSTGALAFSVADADSANVTVTGSSSNTTLIPNGNIVVSPASGAPGARTVTVTPVANGTGGPVTITLTASDGSLTATRTFTVTVTPVNDAPTLTAIANQVIAEDTSTGALAFTVADVDSNNVTVSAGSSNTTLIPNGNIVVSPASGAPGARTVTVTPVANGNGGPVTITLTASDGSLTATRTFTVTVTPVNDPPTISNITDRTVEPNTSTGAIAFTVADPDGDTLTVSASSSVVRVVPTANITLGGSGGNRTITLVPANNQGGTTTITVAVSDGKGGSASDTFVLSVKVQLSASALGPGSVTASGTGCPGGSASCTAVPGAGTVTFVATPDAGAELAGWSGACSGTGNGVITPIPTAGVTCTATFRNLWARLFHSPANVAQQVATVATSVVETPKALHYLGGVPGRDGDTAVVWNAAKDTGDVLAGSAFGFTQDGTSLRPVELLQDGTDGTVALIQAVIRNGSGLLWLDDANTLVRARSYEVTNPNSQIWQTPVGLVRAKDGGLTFLESSRNMSPIAVFPTYGQLVRVSASGAVLGASAFLEHVGACNANYVSQSYQPRALAVNADGNYLVAGSVGALDPQNGSSQLNLTLFDASGAQLWGRHIEATPATRSVEANSISAIGDNFFVTGRISQQGRSMTGFGLLISKSGQIAWWKSFGAASASLLPFNNVAAAGALYVTGLAPVANQAELFVARWDVAGASLRGLTYGDVGSEAGVRIAPAASGGFNAFGLSVSSFGNVAVAAWALRLDAQLRINLDVGNAAVYQPALVNETAAETVTCVGPGHYVATTPTVQELNANATTTTIGGAYQATP